MRTSLYNVIGSPKPQQAGNQRKSTRAGATCLSAPGTVLHHHLSPTTITTDFILYFTIYTLQMMIKMKVILLVHKFIGNSNNLHAEIVSDACSITHY